ncbi:hypothetical protein Pfo_011905 [Paulownia fortunei]|nr:hypothetical protein Pfo_011905 [Paulownia fortunei]
MYSLFQRIHNLNVLDGLPPSILLCSNKGGSTFLEPSASTMELLQKLDVIVRSSSLGCSPHEDFAEVVVGNDVECLARIVPRDSEELRASAASLNEIRLSKPSKLVVNKGIGHVRYVAKAFQSQRAIIIRSTRKKLKCMNRNRRIISRTCL